MKNFKQFFLLPLIIVLLFTTAKGQDNLQNIFQPEYNNPSFNAFKDFYSLNIIARNQWGNNVPGSPEIYGLNFYAPVREKLGMGILVFSEQLGLTSRFIFTGNLSHYVKLTHDNFLGFGYGIGIEQMNYDRSRIYEDNPGIIINGNDLENQLNARAAVGLFYHQPHFYTGISMNITLNTEYSKREVFRGFDWMIGKVFELKNEILIKPEFAVKYYRINEYVYTGSQYEEKWVDPIYRLSCNLFLLNRIWFGISHRFEYAQNYSLDFYINKSMKMGYSFERGIGNGINQFNSHIFRLSWNFWQKKSKSSKVSIFDNSENQTFSPNQSNKLYK